MNFPFQIPDGREFDAAGFGTNAVDYLITVNEHPAFNTKTELESYIQAAGGEVASTMTGLQRLGLKTAYAGRFGGDYEGVIGRQSLVDEGVDVGNAETIAAARTQVGFILIDAKSGERTVLWQRDELLGYTEQDAPVDIVQRVRVLHMTPHDTRACIKMAAAARAAGTIVSIDIDNIFEGIEELLPLVDVCIASAEFPKMLLGIADNREALRELHRRYRFPVVGLTLGETGSLVLCNDRFIESPAFAVPGGCVDTTGAGDAFRTGFLYGLLTEMSVEEACSAANAVASLKCRGIGARDTLPSRTEVQTMLKNV